MIRAVLLPLLALLVLVPSTLPVSVLRDLVQERFGVSVRATTLFMAIQMIGAFLAAPLVGGLSDRLARRKPLVVGALLANAGCLVLLAQPISFELCLAVRFLDGATHITALSVLMALASDRAAPERRGRVMGSLGGGLTLGVALGASLGGVLGRNDPLFPLHAGAGVSTVAALLAAWALEEAPARPGRPTLRAALGALVAERTLAAPLAYAFVDRFTVGFYTTLFPLWLRGIHHVPTPRIGMLLGAFLLPFALLSYPFGKLSERSSRVALTAVGSVLYGLGTASVAFWPPALLWFPMIALGLCSAVMFVPSLVLTLDLAGWTWRGAAMGAFNAAGSLGFILGPLVGGAVVHAGRESEGAFRAAFAVAGASELVCVVFTLPLLLRLVRAGRTT